MASLHLNICHFSSFLWIITYFTVNLPVRAERVHVENSSRTLQPSIRSRSTKQEAASPPRVKTDSLPSHADRSSGRCRGDGMSGRSQFQECADSSGHLGEPSLLQDVQRKTQLSLTKTQKKRKKQWRRGQRRAKEWRNSRVTMATAKEMANATEG